MSIGGNGDDDDLEDELRRLVDEMSELTRLLEVAMTQGRREEEDEDEGEPEGDKWAHGDISPSVDSIDGYESARVEAANTTSVTRPYFSTGVFDGEQSRMEGRYQLYARGFDSLQSIRSALSKDGLDKFMRAYIKDTFDSRTTHELIDILEPSASFFGIRIVDDEMSITRRKSPITYQVVWNNFYHEDAVPWSQLRLNAPTDDEIEFIPAGIRFNELNEEMAKALYKVNRLPDKYHNILPIGFRE